MLSLVILKLFTHKSNTKQSQCTDKLPDQSQCTQITWQITMHIQVTWKLANYIQIRQIAYKNYIQISNFFSCATYSRNENKGKQKYKNQPMKKTQCTHIHSGSSSFLYSPAYIIFDAALWKPISIDSFWMLATVDRAIHVPYFSVKTVVDDSASIDSIISIFSPIVNATIFVFSLLHYSSHYTKILIHCDNVTTAHAQSNQGRVQTIECSYNRAFR